MSRVQSTEKCSEAGKAGGWLDSKIYVVFNQTGSLGSVSSERAIFGFQVNQSLLLLSLQFTTASSQVPLIFIRYHLINCRHKDLRRQPAHIGLWVCLLPALLLDHSLLPAHHFLPSLLSWKSSFQLSSHPLSFPTAWLCAPRCPQE